MLKRLISKLLSKFRKPNTRWEPLRRIHLFGDNQPTTILPDWIGEDFDDRFDINWNDLKCQTCKRKGTLYLSHHNADERKLLLQCSMCDDFEELQ